MNRALGLIEVIGLTNAIIVADTMLKAANVQMENVEITKGMGFVTVKISGDVGAVKAAIDSGKSLAISFDKFVSSKVIPRPAKGLDSVFDLDKENRKDNKSKEIKDNKSKEVKENSPKVSDKETKNAETKVETKEAKVETKEAKEETKVVEKDKISTKEAKTKTDNAKLKVKKSQTEDKIDKNPKVSE
ncbi:BMC domain-containing protein [Peptoniphilus sp. MSJ-1]|uniref:BMC domain-containing protein n=1 Tax=Peptoniphilus ovalis TaxID=2841503 RepID=A0ABS6FHW8_9FIRM|nr:BMC domain-containing protein [Peptoniphilus ovalis]MBU5669772.1 BMC domain-containing protein [Peptoniphilus ovalis]